MSPELDKALCDKYPAIFRDRHDCMKKTAMCWGFECGDGWYDLIDALCECIQNYYDGNHWHDKELSQPVAVQVKEKFGTLRFYYNGGGGLTEGMVWFAEHLSGRICESCAARGMLTGKGWLKTLCQECADKRIK